MRNNPARSADGNPAERVAVGGPECKGHGRASVLNRAVFRIFAPLAE